ncbi:hypothetical protein DPPLL_00790 [Desulfofustis limnaeus]|uniref:Uncharacterized protein n=1 Tax=Desulfofustis limnaeus TaxID=2740163 RepID=A0ABM7W476_9BACT|nr:hypothetical protein DPPLL_00790 [Desulfofustis limnaeus]
MQIGAAGQIPVPQQTALLQVCNQLVVIFDIDHVVSVTIDAPRLSLSQHAVETGRMQVSIA